MLRICADQGFGKVTRAAIHLLTIVTAAFFVFAILLFLVILVVLALSPVAASGKLKMRINTFDDLDDLEQISLGGIGRVFAEETVLLGGNVFDNTADSLVLEVQRRIDAGGCFCHSALICEFVVFELA